MSTTAESEHEQIAAWLAAPEAYSHRPARVEQIETHISRLFLAGELVYKLKKPVKFAFLDFSTSAARERACREELRLNRRLAPDIYLDVVPIVRDERGGYRIGGEGTTGGATRRTGEVVDWLVQMQRLPTEQTLESLHQQGKLRPEQIDRLAETLVDFYRSLAPLSVKPHEYHERCRAHVQENMRELLAVRHHLPRGMVERVHNFQLQLLQLSPETFEDRVLQGRIVEGHGDLRPEHICLGGQPIVFDCIEFNQEFRANDVADELAFLAAECDFLGAEWAGGQLLEAYQRKTGDRLSKVLIAFYKAYRACVRAKVAALRAEQVQGDERALAAGEAARHLEWADRYAKPWVRPLILVVGGLPGTGKSTLAKGLANALGADLLRTDVIRQELYGTAGGGTAVNGDIYRPEARVRVYRELFRRAAALHAQQISVVLDGTFSSASLLREARGLVTDSRAIWLAVECCCPAEVAHERIHNRLKAGGDPSEARPEIHDLHVERWETWPRDLPQVSIDTTGPLEDQVAFVTATLRRHYLDQQRNDPQSG
jgi:uncharacterized protein